jgi:MoaA/NifB/PqqE/SkfB family radical SAM enzyme
LRLSIEVARDVWVRRHPFLLYFKPTARCDCRCVICDRWQRRSREADELSLDAIETMLRKFRRAGIVVLILWGGEPFLRRDLPGILRAGRAAGLRTSLCTNGNLLLRRCDEVVPLIDVMACSIEGYGEVHDELRGKKGLFDLALRGLEAARAHRGCEVKIWTVVHGRNFGDVGRLASLARDLGIGIEFFPISAIAGYNKDLLLTSRQRDEAFGRLGDLKREGYPIRNPLRALEVMRAGRAFSCNYPSIAIHVDHEGAVYSCEDPKGTPLYVWGKQDTLDPAALFASRPFREVTARLKSCNACRLPCTIELEGSLTRALASVFLSRSVEGGAARLSAAPSGRTDSPSRPYRP